MQTHVLRTGKEKEKKEYVNVTTNVIGLMENA